MVICGDGGCHSRGECCGLPPPAPRKARLSRDRARFEVICGLALAGAGVYPGLLGADPSLPYFLGRGLVAVGTLLLYPSAPAAIDYWRNPPQAP
ncbi:MAG: hypothetical protein ACRDP7_41115 [Trebonia sp.]